MSPFGEIYVVYFFEPVFYCESENSNKILIALVQLAQNTSTNTGDSWDRSKGCLYRSCFFEQKTIRGRTSLEHKQVNQV